MNNDKQKFRWLATCATAILVVLSNAALAEIVAKPEAGDSFTVKDQADATKLEVTEGGEIYVPDVPTEATGPADATPLCADGSNNGQMVPCDHDSWVGPQGPQGEQGIQGEQGEPGSYTNCDVLAGWTTGRLSSITAAPGSSSHSVDIERTDIIPFTVFTDNTSLIVKMWKVTVPVANTYRITAYLHNPGTSAVDTRMTVQYKSFMDCS